YESAAAVLRALTDAVEGPLEASSPAVPDPPSLAVYVEATEVALTTADDAHETWIDDALLDALDGARDVLAGLGFSVALEVGNSFVALKSSISSSSPACFDTLRRFIEEVPEPVA